MAKVEELNAQEAVEIMRAAGCSISPDQLRRGLETGAYPFGIYIPGDRDHKNWCRVYRNQLEGWLRERGWSG